MKKPKFITNTETLKKFKKENPDFEYSDIFDGQLRELYLVENPQLSRDKKKAFASDDFKKFKKDKGNDYIFVAIPWQKVIIKTVKKDDYLTLKTNRNRELISKETQKKLRDYKIAALGMSVGSNIAFVLTQAGISNDIIIADFDELETTNLNRIWGGIHQVGLNKAVLASRRIYEDNPFANINVLSKGIDENTLVELLKDKKIDCIVEEVDDMNIKLLVREKAKKYKVPVIMVTDNGDGIVVSVERYDLGYKKFMEQDFSYMRKKIVGCTKPMDFADIVINEMVGGIEKVDPRMIKSVKMISKGQLVSWPQLGSAALLGGVVVTIIVKDVIRGKSRKLFSRHYVNF